MTTPLGCDVILSDDDSDYKFFVKMGFLNINYNSITSQNDEVKQNSCYMLNAEEEGQPFTLLYIAILSLNCMLLARSTNFVSFIQYDYCFLY